MENNNSWVFYGIIGTIFYSLSSLAFKFFLSTKINPIHFACIYWIILGFIGLIYIIVNNHEINDMIIKEKNIILTAFLIALFVFGGDVMFFKGINKCPKTALWTSLESFSIVFISICSYFIFREKLELEDIIGILFIIAGIFIISKKNVLDQKI